MDVFIPGLGHKSSFGPLLRNLNHSKLSDQVHQNQIVSVLSKEYQVLFYFQLKNATLPFCTSSLSGAIFEHASVLNMHLFFIIFKDYFFHFICIFYFFQRWNPLKLPDLAPAGLGSSHPWSPALPFPELLHKLCFLGYLHPTFSGHTPVRSWTSPWSDRFSPRNGLPKVYFPNNQKS